MEMIFEPPNPTLKWYLVDIIIVITVIVVALLVFVLTNANNTISNKELKTTKFYCIIVPVIIISFFWLLDGDLLLYFHDRNNNLTKVAIVEMDNTWHNHSNYYLLSKGKRYYVNIASTEIEFQGELLFKGDFLETNYVGKLCEVEYYKNSRYLIRIKAIE